MARPPYFGAKGEARSDWCWAAAAIAIGWMARPPSFGAKGKAVGSEPGVERARARMVERQLRRRDIHDERVLEAMGTVPRERFVPPEVRPRAYDDSALPIGHRQTISQPWVVAAICQALELSGDERVLEIGTGSGYSAAILAYLARGVRSVERIPELAEAARAALRDLEIDNVELIVGDGSRGLPERAPFEAIAVHAATPEAPRSLLGQLADGGRLVVPIATDSADLLTRFERDGEVLHQRTIGPCRFVPLIGAEGFEASEQA